MIMVLKLNYHKYVFIKIHRCIDQLVKNDDSLILKAFHSNLKGKLGIVNK